MSQGHYNHGHFVWRELVAADLESAQGFYEALFGWSFTPHEMPGGMTYTVIQAGVKQVGGLMAPPAPDVPSHWMSYVSVADVDATVKAATDNGGALVAGPMDIPVGRFAVIRDPAGAHLTVWRDKGGDGGPIAAPKLGEFCWETLSTTDVAGAKAFYGATLRWHVTDGPAGPDSVVFNAPGGAVADVQHNTMAPPHWLTYVVVADAATAREKAASLGAKIVVPMISVPNVGDIVLIADPVGAYLGLFEPKFAG